MSAPRYGGWSAPGPNGMTTTVTPRDTRGPARLWNAPAGYVVRERGDIDGQVTLEYMCPVHGRFEARVSRAESPDALQCPSSASDEETDLNVQLITQGVEVEDACGLASPWSPSTFNAWPSAGETKT